MAKKTIFAEITPLGYRVVLSRDRWRYILRYKHPALTGKEQEAQECVRDPEVVRASEKDPNVHLYYRSTSNGYICVVVAGEESEDRFVVTAYVTKKLKKGTDLWTK